MRDKTPLALMEQIIMIAVFAFAAATSLWAFVSADAMSKMALAKDEALELCQELAEEVRHASMAVGNVAVGIEEVAELEGGIAVSGGAVFEYDKGWQHVGAVADAAYEIRVLEDEGASKGTEGITVQAVPLGGVEELASFQVAWLSADVMELAGGGAVA